jgi:hypothetical protein
MIGINPLRLASAQPHVAQPRCWPAGGASVYRSFSLFIALLITLQPGGAWAAAASNIVVTMDRPGSEPHILLGSKVIPASLRSLSELVKQGVPDRPVLLLLHPKTRISDLWNLIGLMSKAGLSKPRVFVFSEDKTEMNELDIGCSMLFSTDLGSLVPAHGGYGCSK